MAEKGKKPEEKGILETIREVNEKERHERLHMQSEKMLREAKKKDKANEEYEKQLRDEKIEIIRMKQGLTDDNQFEEHTAARKYTLWQRISSFIYCNKAMVITGAFFVFLVSFLIYDLASKERPDITAMILTNDPKLEACCDRLEEIVEEYIDDINGNKEILASMYYMPLSNDLDPYTQQASSTKIFSLMQDGETMLVIGNEESADFLMPDQTLDSLEELYPGNEHVKGYGFYLKDTSFAEDIGYEGTIPDDVYIGIRKVQKGARYREKMQKNYDYAKDLLDNLVERYS
ncbi:MAG: hypothetical protein Q4D76_08720 [Oscillospiraceae bacterium]|nr:hypothetical protein [Oscillospiraceae bacterium]